MSNKAILTDTTECIGCRECVIACKQRYKLEDDLPRRWSLRDGLSADNWTSIVERPGPRFIRKQCRHCLKPACVASCPVGALTKTKMGAVVYDEKKCMGCRYCMMACPYGIPRYDWDLTVPYIRKCIFCADYIARGGSPACTDACPTGATIFGDREELLSEAYDRIKTYPDRYKNKVWGANEVGGTSVIYISDIDLSFLTYGNILGETPLPVKTAPAMTAVPFTFVGMAAAMAGLGWIIGRRQKLNDEQNKDQDKREDSDG